LPRRPTAKARGDLLNEVRLLGPLHMYHVRGGDFKSSLQYARRSSEIASTLNDAGATALPHALLGISLHLMGDLRGARMELEAALEPGARVSGETARRLACDASRVVMRHDPDGRVVEVGALTRTIPAALRRVLHYRDRGCRFPGCGLPLGEGHHIQHWANGGPTTLSNLALLCRRHHRAVHEDGYQMKRQADGELCFWRPDGRLLPEVPPPAVVPTDPVAELRAQHDAQGLHMHARTSTPGWLGERLNVAYAIDVLHPLATG